MAGHSKFKNIQHRKGAQDKKRAKIFTRLLREVSIAARESSSLEDNPKLRKAVQSARAVNIPNDRIDHAIHKEAHKDYSQYSDIQYEAFFPGGLALIIEASTDNKNRSSSEVRSVLSKHGAHMVETGNASFMFKHRGAIRYQLSDQEKDTAIQLAIEDIIQEDYHDEKSKTDISTSVLIVDMHHLHQAIEHATALFNRSPIESSLIWKPDNLIEVPEDQVETFTKMYHDLEDLDDVLHVWTNANLKG